MLQKHFLVEKNFGLNVKIFDDEAKADLTYTGNEVHARRASAMNMNGGGGEIWQFTNRISQCR
jgi:hypothetical protein